MYIFAGLGNPDRKYLKTKHNVGFDAADEIIKEFGLDYIGTSMKAMAYKGIIEGEKVLVIKPLTYMNLSGLAVRAYVDYFKIDPATQLAVIYDDVDMEIGRLRIRKSGSAGSHNGMKHIVECLGTKEFPRIRIGIGPKPENYELKDYVLAPFGKQERLQVEETIEQAPSIVTSIIKEGIDIAMNRFNTRAKE